MSDVDAQAASRPVVVCPLQFERKALVRAGLGVGCELSCCGPGAEAITRWVDRDGPQESVRSPRPVILAGLAGALGDTCAVRSAAVIGAVVGADGRRWTPSLPGAAGGERAVITSVAASVTSPRARSDLARARHADLVDLESEAFAAVATKAGWRWAIVRGISDGPRTALPPGLDRWIDPAGRTRTARVFGGLARRPWLIPSLLRLRGDSAAAMLAVADMIRGMLEEVISDQ